MRGLNWLILNLQSTSKSIFISIILHEMWSPVTMMFDATTLDSKQCPGQKSLKNGDNGSLNSQCRCNQTEAEDGFKSTFFIVCSAMKWQLKRNFLHSWRQVMMGQLEGKGPGLELRIRLCPLLTVFCRILGKSLSHLRPQFPHLWEDVLDQTLSVQRTFEF